MTINTKGDCAEFVYYINLCLPTGWLEKNDIFFKVIIFKMGKTSSNSSSVNNYSRALCGENSSGYKQCEQWITQIQNAKFLNRPTDIAIVYFFFFYSLFCCDWFCLIAHAFSCSVLVFLFLFFKCFLSFTCMSFLYFPFITINYLSFQNSWNRK